MLAARQRFLHRAKQSAMDILKSFKKSNSKNSKVTGDFIGNKTGNKIIKTSRTLPEHSSEECESKTENIGLDEEISKERYISPEKRQKIIDDLILT